MYVCAHRCVNAHTSPAFTMQLCSLCKRLGFKEKLLTLNSCLRAINDWNAGVQRVGDAIGWGWGCFCVPWCLERNRYLYLSELLLCRYPCLPLSIRKCLCVCMTETDCWESCVCGGVALFLSVSGYFATCRDVCACLWVSE